MLVVAEVVVQPEPCLTEVKVGAEVVVGIVAEVNHAVGTAGDVLEIELVMLVAVPHLGLVLFVTSFHRFL